MKRNTIVGIVIALVLLTIAGFYISQIQLGYWIVGQPTPLFIIRNEDSNSHKVDIEIFNSDNESIFKELYILNQSEWKEYPKTQTMTNTESYHTYTFKVTLDNETTKILTEQIDPWTTPVIDLYSPHNKNASGEVIPLDIRVTVV
jgi:hypothetical protein